MADEQIQSNPTVSYSGSEGGRALASIASLLKEADNLLPIIRNEFRGEATMQYDDGRIERVQVSKPLFIKYDYTTNKPIRKTVTYISGEKEIYIVNDEAVEEVLSMLKFMGLNNISRITNIDEETVLDDLLEFECKLAGILMLKQREWGIDKEMLPIIMTKIKTLVQDARYMCVNGSTLKAIQKTVQRMEYSAEGQNKKGMGPYSSNTTQ
jgi:hypothetical protein